MLGKYIFFLNIINSCIITSLGINIDYYFEVDTEQQNVSIFEANPLFQHNKTHNTSKDEIDSEIKDKRAQQKEFEYVTEEIISTAPEEKAENSIKPDYHKITNSKQSVLNNPREFIKPPLNIFNEYEYIYDNEKYQFPDSQYRLYENDALVSGRKHKQKLHNSLNQTRKLKKHKSEKIKLNLLDYYSLEPASAYVNIDKDRFLSDDGAVWYVPQDLPCWQLPLLYGELGFREKSSDVFSINRGYLKNVVHQRNNEKTFSKTKQTPETITYNKWCEIEPCYGDHTLCLFPDKAISNLCEKGYIVKAPTISEQMALINTINSMRNRIAIGESLRYSHLPQAANMMQVTYDFDLEKMAYAWLSQCLPGPAPCSALDGSFVSQLFLSVGCYPARRTRCLIFTHKNKICDFNNVY